MALCFFNSSAFSTMSPNLPSPTPRRSFFASPLSNQLSGLRFSSSFTSKRAHNFRSPNTSHRPIRCSVSQVTETTTSGNPLVLPLCFFCIFIYTYIIGVYFWSVMAISFVLEIRIMICCELLNCDCQEHNSLRAFYHVSVVSSRLLGTGIKKQIVHRRPVSGSLFKKHFSVFVAVKIYGHFLLKAFLVDRYLINVPFSRLM